MRWKHMVENLKKNKFNVWLLPNMFGKNQTRWYIYTWVLISTHVWILTHMYGKRHTCVKKATQLYVWKCLAFSTHVWEKPLTCLFPPELSVLNHQRTHHMIPLTPIGTIKATRFLRRGPRGRRPLVQPQTSVPFSPNLAPRSLAWCPPPKHFA